MYLLGDAKALDLRRQMRALEESLGSIGGQRRRARQNWRIPGRVFFSWVGFGLVETLLCRGRDGHLGRRKLRRQP